MDELGFRVGVDIEVLHGRLQLRRLLGLVMRLSSLASSWGRHCNWGSQNGKCADRCLRGAERSFPSEDDSQWQTAIAGIGDAVRTADFLGTSSRDDDHGNDVYLLVAAMYY
jgi:hypothetical protein